jgi:hypothetical protein
MPPPLDFDAVPFLYPLVGTLRLVFALKEFDLLVFRNLPQRGECGFSLQVCLHSRRPPDRRRSQ